MTRTTIALTVLLVGCVDAPATVTIPAPTIPALVVADTADCYRHHLVLTKDADGGSINCYGPNGEFHSHYLIGRTARPTVWRVRTGEDGLAEIAKEGKDGEG